MTINFFPYQSEGAEFLAARKGALLADEPRVGKTYPAIRACDYVLAEDVLWVTKGSARADHRKAWTKVQMLNRPVTSIYSGKDKLPADGTTIISFDLAVGPFFEQLRERRLDAVVLDEAHRLKNLDAQRTQRMLGKKAERMGGLVEKARHGWALTGTPFPNNYAEVYPIARALFPDALRNARGDVMNYYQFERRFCVLRDNGFGEKIVGNKNAKELHERLAPYMLRRKFNEVWPDASQPVVEQLFLDAQGNLDALTDEERNLIREEYAPQLAAARGDAEMTDQILREIEKRIGPRLQRLTGESKAKPLAAWVADQLENGIGKIVLFAWHRTVIDILAQELKAYRPIVIDGRTTGRQKDAFQEAFQTDPNVQVVIGQIVAAGEAIDLSAADTLVFAEASWSHGDNDQAWRRIVNVNKRSALSVYFATLADSIDEDIQAANERKLLDATKLFEGVD